MKNKRLKKVRESLGKTQQNMSDELGISKSAYSYFEINETASFTNNLLALLARLGVNINWIITGEGEMVLTTAPPTPAIESELTGELEERIRRIKIDVSDIEDTVRRLLQKRR
jgi:transcriptional regulator with XRE-family HTH domain